MIRYEVRAALPEDEDGLFELAGFLNTVNLPRDRAAIRNLLDHSAASFSGRLEDPTARRYVFVLHDIETDKPMGTSMIVAQHGRPDAPYIYYDVLHDEKYSKALERHFRHDILRLGFSYDGPTELGGLVVDPAARRSPERLGRFISCVRLLFIASLRDAFQNVVIAELLPPLEADGTSQLWEALGYHFTGMSYADADVRSSHDKTFIRDLFPTRDICATLLSADAQSVIGKVGDHTKPVERMLTEIGFEYANRVDPFDGGPHFYCNTDQISLVRDARRGEFAGTLAASKNTDATANADSCTTLALVGRHTKTSPYFQALRTEAAITSDGIKLNADAAARLNVSQGASLWACPLPRPTWRPPKK